jgi:hypothetical protein
MDHCAIPSLQVALPQPLILLAAFTAKLNGIEPYLYLCYMLRRLPNGENPEDYRLLSSGTFPKNHCWTSNRHGSRYDASSPASLGEGVRLI